MFSLEQIIPVCLVPLTKSVLINEWKTFCFKTSKMDLDNMNLYIHYDYPLSSDTHFSKFGYYQANTVINTKMKIGSLTLTFGHVN